MSKPMISVIIPARNAAVTLDRTLLALEAQDLSAGSFEVLVVDDHSHDETPEIAKRHAPLVRLISKTKSDGAGAARNLGVVHAQADVLAFTDADCFPTPGWLTHAIKAIADADLVQGRVLPDPGVPRTPFDRTLWVHRDRTFFATANLTVRRDLFDSVGGFWDWTLESPRALARHARRPARPIGEDTLFGWRACRRGARTTFASEALVYHTVLPSTLREAVADRWNWTTKMPSLAKLVPELRRKVFYRRIFLGYPTAQFDRAALGVALALLTRRRLWLLAAIPYVRKVRAEANTYPPGPTSPHSSARQAARYGLGTVVVDSVTLIGLLKGSIEARSLVL